MSGSRRRWSVATLTVGILVGVLALPALASASCFEPDHVDYELDMDGIFCRNSGEEIWTVPDGITHPRFVLTGAGDASGATGGIVKARLPLKAGDVIVLKMGSDGAASSVSRDGEVLLRAGGGDGVEPNFVSADAEAVESHDPGGKWWDGDGFIDVTWYDAREPFDLDEPLPPNPVAFPGAQVETFSYTGTWRTWTVPEGINRVVFDLYGGAGASDQPYGHIVVGFAVAPKRSFDLLVGGPGENTLLENAFLLAAGGDTERPNYLGIGPGYFVQDQYWEGGGPDPQPSEGKAVVYYWWEPEIGLPDPDSPQDPLPNPPVPPAQEFCVVPSLKNATSRSARKRLANASCGAVKVTRRVTSRRLRGRVIRQRPSPGTVIPSSKAVRLIVGR